VGGWLDGWMGGLMSGLVDGKLKNLDSPLRKISAHKQLKNGFRTDSAKYNC